MYKPKIYVEKDKSDIQSFIENNPLAIITGVAKDRRPLASQVPLIFDGHQQNLQGHVMKNTAHYKAFAENPEVLAVFSGPNAYISASWYKHASAASTWNYMSVQVHGKLKFLNHTEFEKMMKRFTLKFENNDVDSPTYFENLPIDYREQHMKAIAGFEIDITSLDATFKLSQDKDEESFQNIINELKQKSYKEQWLASEMEKNLKK